VCRARNTWDTPRPQEILEVALQLPREQCEVLARKLAASLEIGDLGEYWDEIFARLEQRFGGRSVLQNYFP
jgi:hypothetical protein